MDSMDNVRERFEALEQQTEQVKHETQALKAHIRMVERRLRWWRGIACGVMLLGLVSLAPPSHAADFACTAGNVACLINAISTANANGEANTITLEAGTYTLTAVDNTADGPNGLPSVTSTLTLQGAGLDTTVIERDTSVPRFRLVHVAAAGVLTLDGLTLRGGGGGIGSPFNGGDLLNQGGTVAITHTRVTGGAAPFGAGLFNNCPGTVTIAQSLFTGNGAGFGGGGLANAGGTVTITQTTFADNVSQGGGGIQNGFGFLPCLGRGTVTLMNSTLADNLSGGPGGGLLNTDTAILINTTIARNRTSPAPFMGGGLRNSGGSAILINSTIADNRAFPSGGLSNAANPLGTVILANTILARNSSLLQGLDCDGPATSLGHNLIGDPTGCTLTLLPTDLTGDPGLGDFTDDGTPGNGHIPLRRGSPAIDAGNDAFCLPTDQLGRRRVDIRRVGTSLCDMGAIEFRPRDDRQHDEEDD